MKQFQAVADNGGPGKLELCVPLVARCCLQLHFPQTPGRPRACLY